MGSKPLKIRVVLGMILIGGLLVFFSTTSGWALLLAIVCFFLMFVPLSKEEEVKWEIEETRRKRREIMECSSCGIEFTRGKFDDERGCPYCGSDLAYPTRKYAR